MLPLEANVGLSVETMSESGFVVESDQKEDRHRSDPTIGQRFRRFVRKAVQRLFWRRRSQEGDALEFDDQFSQIHHFRRLMRFQTQWRFLEMGKEVLYRGDTAIVVKGRYHGTEVAIKLYQLKPTDDGITWSSEEAEDEIRVAEEILHPHIVGYYCYARSEQRIGLAMEFARHGDLHDYLLKGIFGADGIQTPTLRMRLQWLMGILSALTYLHEELDFVHRDLKAENVVLCHGLCAKLIDFGLSEKMGRRVRETMFAGTNLYRAPEIMRADGVSGKPADVFAFSMIAFMVVTLLVGNPYTFCDEMELHAERAAAASGSDRLTFGVPAGVGQEEYYKHLIALNSQERNLSRLMRNVCSVVAQSDTLRPVFPDHPLWSSSGPLLRLKNYIVQSWDALPENRPTARQFLMGVGDLYERLDHSILMDCSFQHLMSPEESPGPVPIPNPPVPEPEERVIRIELTLYRRSPARVPVPLDDDFFGRGSIRMKSPPKEPVLEDSSKIRKIIITVNHDPEVTEDQIKHAIARQIEKYESRSSTKSAMEVVVIRKVRVRTLPRLQQIVDPASARPRRRRYRASHRALLNGIEDLFRKIERRN